MALESYVLLNNKSKAQQLAKIIAQRLSQKEWMSTQTTSYCLLAMAKFAKMVGGKGVKASYNVNGDKIEVNSSKPLINRSLKISEGDNTIILENKASNLVYGSIITNGVLPVGNEKITQRNFNLISKFKGRNGSVIDVSSIIQGTDFIAEVILTNTTSNAIKNVALTEIFPSGWEIVNTRFTDFGDFAENDVEYTDLKDDRANFYFDLKKNETKKIRVLLNASYLGTYYLPGVQVEAMYDKAYEARTKGKWVNVVR